MRVECGNCPALVGMKNHNWRGADSGCRKQPSQLPAAVSHLDHGDAAVCFLVLLKLSESKLKLPNSG